MNFLLCTWLCYSGWLTLYPHLTLDNHWKVICMLYMVDVPWWTNAVERVAYNETVMNTKWDIQCAFSEITFWNPNLLFKLKSHDCCTIPWCFYSIIHLYRWCTSGILFNTADTISIPSSMRISGLFSFVSEMAPLFLIVIRWSIQHCWWQEWVGTDIDKNMCSDNKL